MSIGVTVAVLSQGVASLFVVDIVKHVTQVPNSEIRSKFDLLGKNLKGMGKWEWNKGSDS